jgi:SAM-dependent methyltransferase
VTGPDVPNRAAPRTRSKIRSRCDANVQRQADRRRAPRPRRDLARRLPLQKGRRRGFGLFPADVRAFKGHAAFNRVPERVPVSLLRGSAEHGPFADAVFDTMVMTWTLCSIPNPIAALTEMRRVLRPGGRLIFVEHGLSPEISTSRWQRRLTPYWKRISGGCHLDRKTDDLIRAAGFQIDAVETGYMTGPKPWTFMYQGSATN